MKEESSSPLSDFSREILLCPLLLWAQDYQPCTNPISSDLGISVCSEDSLERLYRKGRGSVPTFPLFLSMEEKTSDQELGKVKML